MTELTVDGIAVVQEISPKDEMFNGNESYYFSVGKSALECVRVSLESAGLTTADVKHILDLPCGHGRVLRYLKSGFPNAEIVACDLLRDGVDFCERTFGVTPVYSHEETKRIPVADGMFDLIWVGSLLTHLDSPRWIEFLEFFRKSLRPGGVVVFTTHGHRAYEAKLLQGDTGLPYWLNTSLRYHYDRAGFGYVNYPGNDSYGYSVSSPGSVFNLVEKIDELRVVHFSEKGWVGFQDVFACVRDPNWPARYPPIPTSRFLKHKLRECRERLRRK